MKKVKALIMMMLFSAILMSVTSLAGIVQPSGKKDYHDKQAILKELKTNHKAKLVKGKTYYLNSALLIPSNCMLDATGATIVASAATMRNLATKANYSDLKNVTIIGGTWKSAVKGGYGTGFQFAHASNLTFKNMNIVNTNYTGHALELVACRNVKIQNCHIAAQGKKPAAGKEEMIQIDVATAASAPFLPAKLQNNAACRNISITNSVITGCRAVGANLGGKFSENITITGCKLTGTSGEGVSLFNVVTATIKNNTIISKSKEVATADSVGLHLGIMGTGNSKIGKAKYIISGNTIKGGRQGLEVYSHTRLKFGTVKITNNKVYAKAGAKDAIWAAVESIKKLVMSKNKAFKW